MDAYKIAIRLSDGSTVYNVIFYDDNGVRVTLCAKDKKHADTVLDALADCVGAESD